MTADKPGEIHVHSSPTEQEFEYQAGSSTFEVKPIPAPGGSRSSPTRSARSSSSSSHGDAAPDRRAAPRARPRRRPGPPDLAWPGDHRRRDRSRALVRRTRAGLADPPVRRSHQRPAGSRLAVGVRRLGLVARVPAPGRPARAGLPDRDRGPRQGPPDQPDLRHLLRLDLGRRAGRLGALRPGLAGDQPVPADQRGHRPRLGRSSGRGADHLSGAARHVAGRTRSVRVRLDGAGLPPQRRPLAGATVARRLPGPDDHRRRAVREHVLRAGRPVRGVLLADRPAVDLGTPRRAAGPAQPAGQPRHDPGDARPRRRHRRCSSAARRSTPSETPTRG